jgi:hypothetical protein
MDSFSWSLTLRQNKLEFLSLLSFSEYFNVSKAGSLLTEWETARKAPAKSFTHSCVLHYRVDPIKEFQSKFFCVS